MAKNIFLEREEYAQDRPRNVFDLSFSNHLTMKFGTLYPVFCKEVLPGDSFRIKTAFGLQFMPMVFPIQTRMRAHMHFFYVRNRTLWKDWMDYIYGTKTGLNFPVIAQNSNSDFWKTGSLADYLGVPTTIVGKYASQPYLCAAGTHGTKILSEYLEGKPPGKLMKHGKFVSGSSFAPTGAAGANLCLNQYAQRMYYFHCPRPQTFSQILGNYAPNEVVFGDFVSNGSLKSENSPFYASSWPCVPFITPLRQKVLVGGWKISSSATTTYTLLHLPCMSNITISDLPNVGVAVFVANKNEDYLDSRLVTILDPLDHKIKANGGSPSQSVPFIALSNPGGNAINRYIEENYDVYITLVFASYDIKDFPNYVDFVGDASNLQNNKTFGHIITFDPAESTKRQVSEINFGSGPYNPYGTSGPSVISALRFRAYQAIFNSFYRNTQNNPFRINGVVEYNKYITTDAGGTDTTPYHLYQRDWEKDFLTSAVQSPQQGIAPLVGLVTKTTPLGRITLQNPDSSGNTEIQFTFAADGHTVEGYKAATSIDPTLNGLLVNAIEMGLSINDLRNVNALQRWAETNMRRGFRYRDLTKGQYDVDIKYDEVDMPEFIGGFSRDVQVTPIHQMVQTSQVPLGDLAGNASIFGTSEHEISHFCDEHGFIMGILSVVPEPSYSQLIPKDMLKVTSPLDFYFPEFGKIGLTPIQMKEVAPVQVMANAVQTNTDATAALDSVFGYQRAWYDYIASVNEVHGLLRTSLRDYLMNRTFDSPPQLGESFISVDPSQLNDVFAVQTSGDDKIVGQVIFEVSAKRQIPRMGIPALE